MSAGIRAGSSNDGYVQVNGNDIITALSGGNVGIGNTSPSTKLHVTGDITATNFIGNISGTPEFSGDLTIPQWIIHAGDTDTKLGFPSADAVDIFAGGKQVRLTSSGHLGINRTTPAAPITARRLDAGGTGTSGVIAEFANSSGYGVWFGQSSASGASWGATTGDFYWNTGGLSSQVERLRINSTGKVTVKSNAANSVAIALVDNDSSNEIWRVGQAADGDGYVEVLEDGGTVGCKLDASGNSFTMGNFGIGDASPSQLLTISHAANTTNGILIKNTNNSQGSAIAQLELSGGDNSHGRVQFECNGKYSTIRHDGNGHLSLWTNGSNERLRIDDGGSVTIGDAATHTFAAHSEGDDLVIGGAGWRGMTIYGEGGGGVIQFADNGDNRRGQILYNHSNDSMKFRTGGNADRLTISSIGEAKFIRSSSGGTVGHFYANQRECNILLQNDAKTWKIVNYDYGNNGTDFLGFHDGTADRLIITDWGIIMGRTNDYWNSSAIFQRDHNSRTHILVKNDTNGANAESAITLNASGNSYKISCGAAGNNSNAFTIARDATANSGAGWEKFRLDTNDFFYFNTQTNGTTNGNVDKRYNWGSTNNLNFGMQCTTRQRYSIWEHRQIGRTQARTAQMSCGENPSNQGTVIMYSSTANADVTGGVNLTNGATSWSGNSDMRLKNKTGDILNALEDINKIEPIRFTWKYGPDNNPHVGVSAQSVENVVPEAIDRGVDVERQREGDETEYMKVRYTELIPLSIAAIKELKAEVESLKAEVASLKSS